MPMRQPTDPQHRRRGAATLAALVALTAFTTSGLVACAEHRPAPNGLDPVRLAGARFVLLGEVHDNAEQHRKRAALLSRLLSDGRPTAVVFEQLDRGHDATIGAAPRNAEAVATAGRLDRAGWGWPLHKPLFEAALAGGATLSGGDLSNTDARAVVTGGAASVPDDLRPLLDTAGWSAADEASVEQEIGASHCGALPTRLWPAMALAQRARDAALAGAMVAAARQHERVVLIAGNGHVRRDLGVPRYLIGAGTGNGAIVSIGYLEAPDPDAPYDIVDITPAASRPDPCVDFKPRP